MLDFFRTAFSGEKMPEDEKHSKELYDALIQELRKGKPVEFGLITYTPADKFTPENPVVSFNINKKAVASSSKRHAILYHYDQHGKATSAQEIDPKNISAKKAELKKFYQDGRTEFGIPSLFHTKHHLTVQVQKNYKTEGNRATLSYQKTYRMK